MLWRPRLPLVILAVGYLSTVCFAERPSGFHGDAAQSDDLDATSGQLSPSSLAVDSSEVVAPDLSTSHPHLLTLRGHTKDAQSHRPSDEKERNDWITATVLWCVGAFCLVGACVCNQKDGGQQTRDEDKRRGSNDQDFDEFEEWEMKTCFRYVALKDQVIWCAAIVVLGFASICVGSYGLQQQTGALPRTYAFLNTPCETIYRLVFAVTLIPGHMFAGIPFSLVFYGELHNGLILAGFSAALLCLPWMLLGGGLMAVGCLELISAVGLYAVVQSGIAFRDVLPGNLRLCRWWMVCCVLACMVVLPLALYKDLARHSPRLAAGIYVCGIPFLETLMTLVMHYMYLFTVYNPRAAKRDSAMGGASSSTQSWNSQLRAGGASIIVRGDQKLLLSLTGIVCVAAFSIVRFLMLVESVLVSESADPTDLTTAWLTLKWSLAVEAILEVLGRLRLPHWLFAQATLGSSGLLKFLHECVLPTPLALYCNELRYQITYIPYASVCLVMMVHEFFRHMGNDALDEIDQNKCKAIVTVGTMCFAASIFRDVCTYIGEVALPNQKWEDLPYFRELEETGTPRCHPEQIRNNPTMQHQPVPPLVSAWLLITLASTGFLLLFFILGQGWILGFEVFDSSLDTTSMWWPLDPAKCGHDSLWVIVKAWLQLTRPPCVPV